MASLQILNQSAARDHDPGGAVLIEASHRSQPGFESPEVVLDPIIGMLDGVVERPGHQFVEDAWVGLALSVAPSAGSQPFALIALENVAASHSNCRAATWDGRSWPGEFAVGLDAAEWVSPSATAREEHLRGKSR